MTDPPMINAYEDGQLVYRPMNDAELAQWQADQQAAAVAATAAAATHLRQLLAASDWWGARAVEDAVPMPANRIAYRQQLRTLLEQLNAGADPATLILPELPTPPPGEGVS